MSSRFSLPSIATQERVRTQILLAPKELPPLHLILQEDPMDQLIADAYNANSAILAYSNAINQTTIPALPQPPSWYEQFIKDFSSAKQHALIWQNSIAPRLGSIPQAIVSYGSIFNFKAETIREDIAILRTDPNNQGAKDGIKQSLQQLLASVTVQQGLVRSLKTDMESFSKFLQDDEVMLAKAVQDAEATIGVNKQQIADLQRSIGELKAEIASYNRLITAGGITAGVSVFVGAVGAVLTAAFGPLGLLVVAIGVIGFTAGIIMIIVGAAKVKELSARVTAQTSEMNTITQQVASLTTLNDQVKNLIALSEEAHKALQKILQAWSDLENRINTVVTDLDKATLDQSDLNLLEADINQAQDDWDQLITLAKKFAGVTYSVSEDVKPITA